jgi:hypothetical protein
MEFFRNLFGLPLAEQVSNFHGLLATVSPLVFGAKIVLIFMARKCVLASLYKPTLWALGIQSILLGAASIVGIVAYVAYRTAGGAREFLLSSPQTSWLHNIVFEYKEYLCAITPWLLLMVAFFVVLKLGPEFFKNKGATVFVFASIIVAAVFAMFSAALAVLVSKIAPLEKFPVGQDLFPRGGFIAIGAAFATLFVLAGLFWGITARSRIDEKQNSNALAAMIYGAIAGITVLWVLNATKEAIAPLKTWLTFVPSIGPYSGVVFFSLVAIVVVAVAAWLITMKSGKQASLKASGWALIAAAVIQAIFLFPPVYHSFLPS